MRVKKAVAALLTAGLVSSGIVAVATPASAAPYCEPGWYRDGTPGLVDKKSGWIGTRPDIAGRARSVQFQVLTNPVYRYTYSNCNQGPRTAFPTAAKARFKDHSGIHAWGYINGPSRGFKFPGKCAGWDIVSQTWKTWSC
jgi:hypothetical protein